MPTVISCFASAPCPRARSLAIAISPAAATVAAVRALLPRLQPPSSPPSQPLPWRPAVPSSAPATAATAASTAALMAASRSLVAFSLRPLLLLRPPLLLLRPLPLPCPALSTLAFSSPSARSSSSTLRGEGGRRGWKIHRGACGVICLMIFGLGLVCFASPAGEGG